MTELETKTEVETEALDRAEGAYCFPGASMR